MDRQALSRLILARLQADKSVLQAAWNASRPVRHFVVDHLLPEELAREIFAAFPAPETLRYSDDLRERKYAGQDVDRFHPLVRDTLYAFQDPSLLALLEEITGLRSMEADPSLYASGVSLMERGHFLNPHLDNSHDGEVKRYRVLNALYYVTPDWTAADGGSLELWDAPGRERVEVMARFNRLVLMRTDRRSWHSVSPVAGEGRRSCVSNYYFSSASPEGEGYRHVTSFKGRPGQGGRTALLALDAAVRGLAGRFLSNRALERLRRALYRPRR